MQYALLGMNTMKGPEDMKKQRAKWETAIVEFRLGRILLHARCLLHDHKCRWHLAGIWREVTVH